MCEKPWTLSDWRGRVLDSGRFGYRGLANLGCRPVGYYSIKSESHRATFAVVPPIESRCRNADSFYGVDSAQSWVSRPGNFDCPWHEGDTYRLVSDLIERTGLAHVRERLSASDTNPRPGVYDYKWYRYNADLLHARGILISGIFHDVPAYMGRIRKLPRDLAALSAFCRETARAFGACMGDWEFWNEQDIHFAPEPVWDYVAAFKAASLGFRAGRPGITVLPGALCDKARSPYDAGLYANDAAKYADAFNFHTYVPLCDYPAVFGELRRFMQKTGIGGRAVWLTESGTNLEGHSDADGARPGLKAHSPAQELIQAEFYAKSQIALQMQGVSRNYFFVFGAYNEAGGKKDWGVMRRDGTVKPTYAAMSTIVRELAQARLLGELKLGATSKGYLFEQPNGMQTLAFWSISPVDTAHGTVSVESDCAQSLKLPIPSGDYTLTDLCGQRHRVTSNVVTAMRWTAYLSGLRGLKADVAPFPRGTCAPYVPAPDEDLSVIFRVDLNTNDFVVSGHKSVAELRADTGRLCIHIWNLEARAKRGTVAVSGGSVIGLPAEIDLPSNGEASFDCVYAALPRAPLVSDLTLAGLFDGRRSSRLVVPVRNEKAFLSNCRAIDLKNALDPKAWGIANTSADQYSVAWDDSEQALRFDFAWTKGQDDRWFYPVYKLKLPEESFADGLVLEFEVKSVQDKVENDFAQQNLMLVFAGSARADRYISYSAPLTGWETRRVSLYGEEANAVRAFRLGANPHGRRCTFWLRNLRILKRRGAVRPDISQS